MSQQHQVSETQSFLSDMENLILDQFLIHNKLISLKEVSCFTKVSHFLFVSESVNLAGFLLKTINELL